MAEPGRHATMRDAVTARVAASFNGRVFPALLGSWRTGGAFVLVKTEQSTVARRVACRGIGLHRGDEVEIALCPAEPGSGIVFVVHPEPNAAVVEIPARARSVLSSSRATSLTDGQGTTVSTVEHLLATLYVLGIDNVRVEVHGTEIPMMDGSALPFVEWVRSAGRVGQRKQRIEYDVVRPLEFTDGERSIRVEPHPVLRISYGIDFDHPSIGRQSLELSSVEENLFEREIAAARTFGFEHEIDSLRAAGLAIGGSFENALVLSEGGVLNESGLRWPDEFVRHKVIDLLGDLCLLGARLNGHVQVERGGHSLHHQLVQGLLGQVGLLEPVPRHDAFRPSARAGRVQSLA